MSDKSPIEWTSATWNPTTGCDRVSPGCDNCYALTLAKRLKGMGSRKYQRDGNPKTSGPGFGLTVHSDALGIPMRWREPRRVFVNSMSDLFHDDVPDEFIARVFAVMLVAQRHTFQVLTKRHGRMRSLLNRDEFMDQVMEFAGPLPGRPMGVPWPLPNVWLGVSVEDQRWADIRIPALLDTPAAVRWLSCEPLLGPVDLTRLAAGRAQQPEMVYDALNKRYGVPDRWQAPLSARVDWVVAGGESGPGARPMHPDWARTLRDQCQAAGVPFFFKQHGAWEPIGPLYEQHADDEEAEEARWHAVDLEVADNRKVIQLERSGYIAEGHQPTDPRTWLMARVGKKAAGRVLDGRTWDEYPTSVRG